MKHPWKPHSKIMRKHQSERTAERFLWTDDRPVAFYAPVQDNTTQERNWIYIEATEQDWNPRFLCSSISRWLWRSTARNFKCCGPVPYVCQRSSTAMFFSVQSSLQLCCSKSPAAVCVLSHGAAVDPKPRASSILPVVFEYPWKK